MPTSPAAPDLNLPALTLDELTQPTRQQRARLLDLARRVYRAKPWKRLEENEVFIVKSPAESPADGALLFVSTIGGAGEQAGVIIYRGADAYFGLLDFLERAAQMPAIPQMAEGLEDAEELLNMLADALSEANFNPMELMQLPQLQLMFEPRAALEEFDRAWIEEHSYKASGAAFPTFRGVASGFLPWWISDVEADLLAVALEQLLEVVERKNPAPDLTAILELERPEGFALEMFARTSTTGADGVPSWADERLVVESSNSTAPVKLAFDAKDEAQAAQISALPASREIVEVALVSMPAPVGDASTRPHFPTMLLLGHEDEVVGTLLLPCGLGAALLPQIARSLGRLLAERSTRPATLQFSSPDLEILNAIGPKLGIAVEEVEELPTLDAAIESLMEQLENADFDLDEEEPAEPKSGTAKV